MFLVALVGFSVCKVTWKSYGQILMKFSGNVVNAQETDDTILIVTRSTIWILNIFIEGYFWHCDIGPFFSVYVYTIIINHQITWRKIQDTPSLIKILGNSEYCDSE